MILSWPDEIKEKMSGILTDMPLAYRKYIDPNIHQAANQIAGREGKSEVDEDLMIRAMITSIPRHLRNGLREVLTDHHIDILYYRQAFDEPNINSPINHQSVNHTSPPASGSQ